MSLRSKLESLEKKLPQKETQNDPIYPYVVRAEYFDHICRELHATFEPAPDLDELRQEHLPEQALDIWMRHYSYYDAGILKVPPPEWIAEYDGFASMSLDDWYESVLCGILKYPHILSFELADFNLEHYAERVRESAITNYAPERIVEPD